MTRAWTPLELVRWTAGYFGEHGVPTPRLDAEVLLGHVLGLRRIDLYAQFDRPVQPDERQRYRELVRLRAAKRTPVAYLTGVREFWSRAFEVSPAVLIPRPETETLVRAALERPARQILEVGVGSGAIAATLAAERPELRIVASDCSAAALAVARANLARHAVSERVALVRTDVVAGVEGHFDLIVSNPPYVPTAELPALAAELAHEPVVALDGGPDGLDVIRRILQDGPGRLRPGAGILLEVGAGQAAAVSALLREAGAATVERWRDLAGIERVVLGSFGERSAENGACGSGSGSRTGSWPRSRHAAPGDGTDGSRHE